MNKIITITTEYIRLDALLKLAGAVGTGGEAKQQIQTGQVSVDGEVCTQRGRKIREGQVVGIGKDTVTVKNGAD